MTNSSATDTRNIVCDIPDEPNGVITFDLLTFFAANDTEGFPQKSYSLTLSATGQGTQALPVPSSDAWLWEIGLPDGNKPKATLAAGADLQLTAWLASALSTETANSLEDYFLLLAGGTMTGAVTLASMTTAERDALTPAEGMAIYNETTATVQVYQGAAWVSVGSGSGGGLANVVEDTTPQLGGDLDAQGNDITDMGDITFKTGAAGGVLRTGTASADRFILAAYDVNDATYRTVIELDAGNDVVMQLIADYLALEDAADTTKHVEWDLSGATGSTATTLTFAQTAARVITFPDETGTVLTNQGGTLAGTLAMADNLITRPVIKDYGETPNNQGDTGGGTVDIDFEDGNFHSLTVSTSTTTFTFSNPPASGTVGSLTLEITNGGSQTVNWPGSVTWAGGSAPTLTAAGVDVLTFYTRDGGTTYRGFAAGLDMS